MWRRPFPWFIVAAALLYALYPYFTDDVGMRESLLLAAVYIILASNLNLMIGYAGYVISATSSSSGSAAMSASIWSPRCIGT